MKEPSSAEATGDKEKPPTPSEKDAYRESIE
jgi:hypothetical protein